MTITHDHPQRVFAKIKGTTEEPLLAKAQKMKFQK
jgi:hypothetical protein